MLACGKVAHRTVSCNIQCTAEAQ